MKPANDNTTGPTAANDNALPRVTATPDIDDETFDRAAAIYDRMLADVDIGMVGTWYGMPADKHPSRGYVYHRCGLRGKPMSQERAATLRQYGWIDAPKGTRLGGCESDGDNGHYMYVRVDLYRRMKDFQARARAEKERRKLHPLQRMAGDFFAGEQGDTLRRHGVTIETTHAETGQASFDEIAERNRQAAGRAKR